MLTPEEKSAKSQIEATIDNLALFQSFDWKRLKSGTDKLTSQEGNLVIRISIIEKNKTIE